METEKIKRCGFELELEGSKIVAITKDPRKVNLGQLVRSNGRFLVPENVVGIVIGIHIPFQDGKTSDILDIWFEGRSSFFEMKIKDLKWR